MMTPERRTWLSGWKEQAVQALPTVAPVDVKVAVRRAVDTALAPFGPETHLAEIQDLVTTVVHAIKEQWMLETRAQEQEARKEQLLQCPEQWIDEVMLSRLPSDIVGAPHSPKRLHVQATLRQQIRRTLSAELTGDETVESVIQRVQEELATWAMEQNPEMTRRMLLRRLAPWAVTALAGGLAATAWSPNSKLLRAPARGCSGRGSPPTSRSLNSGWRPAWNSSSFGPKLVPRRRIHHDGLTR